MPPFKVVTEAQCGCRIYQHLSASENDYWSIESSNCVLQRVSGLVTEFDRSARDPRGAQYPDVAATWKRVTDRLREALRPATESDGTSPPLPTEEP